MRISASQYAKTLTELSKEGSADTVALAASFLSMLRRKRDLRKWPAIFRMCRRMADAQAGKISLLAETACMLDETSRRGLESLAEEMFPGKKLVIRYEVRPGIIGGARLSSDDEMVDATVRRRLSDLEKIMR